MRGRKGYYRPSLWFLLTKGNNFVYRFLKYSCFIQHCNILRYRPSLCRAICKACAAQLKPRAHGTDVGVFKDDVMDDIMDDVMDDMVSLVDQNTTGALSG